MTTCPDLIAKVCDIIKSAHKHNVQRLRLGDLEIDFFFQGKDVEVPKPVDDFAIKSALFEESGELSKVSLHTSEEREVDLAQLMIEDPAGYEKFIQDMSLEAQEQ